MHFNTSTIQAFSQDAHFEKFSHNTIGNNQIIDTPFGKKPLIYADWIASGRLYNPIEAKLQQNIGPFVANTHTETSFTGAIMTHAYEHAKALIKKHVGAGPNDALLAVGTGMTAAINKLQRMLGLRIPEQFSHQIQLEEQQRPVVFITHMEHHSNQTSWLETIATVVIIPSCAKGLVCLDSFNAILKSYQNRPLKIASVTACSNVTGIETPYYEIAQRIHAVGGFCFVDFACSAPYVAIQMHPTHEPNAHLDAIFFSPHKFLGGPGTPGIVVFNKKLYQLKTPDMPGGGTVAWTNPWGKHRYFDDIEAREDGGTPGFLQLIKTALALQLKEKMGVEAILKQEHEQVNFVFEQLNPIPNLHILAGEIKKRIGAISFYIEGLHYNLCVKLLNDLYGIQTRGGCSCAGTYGHYLLQVNEEHSNEITNKIDSGDLSSKPGWVRLSLHPTMNYETIHYITQAIAHIATHSKQYQPYYEYIPEKNAFKHIGHHDTSQMLAQSFFES